MSTPSTLSKYGAKNTVDIKPGPQLRGIWVVDRANQYINVS